MKIIFKSLIFIVIISFLYSFYPAGCIVKKKIKREVVNSIVNSKINLIVEGPFKLKKRDFAFLSPEVDFNESDSIRYIIELHEMNDDSNKIVLYYNYKGILMLTFTPYTYEKYNILYDFLSKPILM
jgi:hypothetical protein